MDKRGKSFLIVGVILFILVLNFSVFVLSLSSENTKTYDSNTKTVSIKDNLNEGIADIKLNTPLVHYVMRGKDRLVIEYTITIYKNYSDVFSKLDFYNVKNNMKKFDRDFTYRYKVFSNIEVDDYEGVCKERTSTNGSIEKYDCVQNKIGTHAEQRGTWNDFNEKADLPKGEITIGIFTDVLPDERVEWVPTLFDVEINEWAVWNESFNIGLTHAYQFNESSGTNSLDSRGRDIGNQYNLTLFNGATFGVGINGSGLVCDGVNDYALSSGGTTGFPTGTDEWTVSFWIYDDEVDTGMSVSLDGAQEHFQAYSFPTPGINFYAGGTINTIFDAISNGNWKHNVYVRNASSIVTYVDGIQKTNAINSNSITTGNLVLCSDPLGISGNVSVSLDEVYFWNRSLSASEVLALNDTSMVYGISAPPDSTPPDVIIVFPSPTNYTAHSIDFNITAIDETRVSSCWYTLNNGINNITMGNDTASNFYDTNSSIAKGDYTAKFYCNDTSNNINDSEQVSFIILNSAPTHTNPLLSTLSGKNFSYENLTCYNQSTSDADNDEVINVYNWYKNSQPLLSLNLPFEGGSNSSYTKDYSGYENNDGTVSSNAVWKSSGGYNGKGAYDVTLNGATITIPHKVTVNPTDEITVMAWLKYNDTYCDSNYGGSAARPIAKGQNEAFELQTYEWLGNCTARFCINATCPDLGETSGTAKGNWAHITGSFNGTHINTYFNGNLDVSIDYSGKIPFITDDLIIGDWTPNFGRGFMGIIDEVRIYPYALTPEQIKTIYEGKTNLIPSEETSGGDNYMCQVTPNDGEVDGDTKNSSELEILWEISFNVTSGEDGSQISNFDVSCNNSWGVTGANSFEEFGFEPGSYECEFARDTFFNKTKIFIADEDKVIGVSLSLRGALTIEEHTWLEAIYNCLYLGDCSLYNLLLEINQTVGNIWEHTKPTDDSVITSEIITNKIVNSTNNLTIDYTVNIPVKAGYVSGTYLPLRIGFWFLDTTNTTCYNQGNKPTEVEEPYCQPLVIETIGPMGGSTSFTVEMRPELPAGDYSIKRIIDIDPLGVWINYGSEVISDLTMLETLSTYGASTTTTGESMPSSRSESNHNSDGSSSSGGSSKKITNVYNTYNIVEQEEQQTPSEDGVIHLNKPGITGGAIGTGLLSGWDFAIVLGIFAGLFIVIVISRTVLRIKKKVNNYLFISLIIFFIIIKSYAPFNY